MKTSIEEPTISVKKQEFIQDGNDPEGNEIKNSQKSTEGSIKKQYLNKKQISVHQSDLPVIESKYQTWSPDEVKRIFIYFDQNNSKKVWSDMSKEISHRNSRDLKNRFYIVLRSILRNLFRYNSQKCPKHNGMILSKDLHRLYTGRQSYEIFSGFMRYILKTLEYDVQSREIRKIAQQCSETIGLIYQAMYYNQEGYHIRKTKYDIQPLPLDKIVEMNKVDQIQRFDISPYCNSRNQQKVVAKNSSQAFQLAYKPYYNNSKPQQVFYYHV